MELSLQVRGQTSSTQSGWQAIALDQARWQVFTLSQSRWHTFMRWQV